MATIENKLEQLLANQSALPDLQRRVQEVLHNQKSIEGNQSALKSLQASMKEVLENQSTIEKLLHAQAAQMHTAISNQAKLDSILANQAEILAKVTNHKA